MISPNCQVIGLTGSFGSGCTTAARHLETEMNFKNIKLSDVIRAAWKDHGPPQRVDLQRLGDELRDHHGGSVLVERSLEALEAETVTHDRVVIDGIRNLGEIDHLRQRFGFHFTLIAVLADSDSRWGRVGDEYIDRGQGQSEFLDDDARDKNEESPTGQEVELCIDSSDIVLSNNDDVTKPAFRAKVTDYANRVLGLDGTKRPSEQEILMHQASSTRHGSRCVKRQVGAVIVDDRNWVVSAGYNENPTGTAPCVDEPEYQAEGPCFRDIVRNAHFRTLGNDGARCPVCAEQFGVLVGPPWHCPNCRQTGTRTNLESYFFPDRAMNMCTAIHAEVWALFAAGDRARGATLYTTTFPCMQCAEKIIHADIRKVVYTEAYPDPFGRMRFEIADVALVQFEGVKSSAFERIYGRPVGD